MFVKIGREIIIVVSLVCSSYGTEVFVKDSQTLHKIDSLQKKIDSIKSIINSDKVYYKMRTGEIQDKINYLKILLTKKFKDSSDILKCASQLMEHKSYEAELMYLIMKTQDNFESKALVNENRMRVKSDITIIGKFIERVTPKQNLTIERER